MHYLAKFSKESSIKFVGHLDLMRTIQRLLRRSELPLEFSNGFNPHVNISLAQPLAVGVYSSGDYLDLSLEKDVDTEVIQSKLNKSAPSGIKVFKVVKVKDVKNKKIFKSMAAVDAARYTIKIRYKSSELLEHDIDELIKRKQWNIIKKSKSGENNVDIKLLIKSFKYIVKENTLIINTLIACGSRQNLSPELMAKFIQNNTGNVDLNAFVDIRRDEMYAYLKNKLVPLYEAAQKYNS